MTLAAQCFGDVQLGLRGRSGEDHFGVVADQRRELFFGQPIELLIGDHGGVSAGDADPFGDRGSGQRMVAGDHDDADSRGVALSDRFGDALPRRIQHRDQPHQTQVAFRVVPTLRHGAGVG